MTDQRQGRPSASKLHRLALCPGSWALESICEPEPENPFAASGTTIHSVLAGEQNMDILNDDELWVVARCAEIETMLKEAVFGDGHPSIIREKRMYYRSPTQPVAEFLYSGQPDAIYWEDGRFLVIDYKTGRSAVPAASENIQMRALAVLTAQGMSVDGLHVAIIQPRSSERYSLAHYTAADLQRAEREICDVIERASAADAPRIPGESQCQYCRARGICPEIRETALTPIEQAVSSRDQVQTYVQDLTPEQMAEWLPRIELAEVVAVALKQRAKEMLADGISIPGYGLKDGSIRREITDAQAAYARLSDVLSTEAFTRCCKVQIGSLEGEYAEAAGISKKAARDHLTEVLNGVIEAKQSAPSLVKIE